MDMNNTREVQECFKTARRFCIFYLWFNLANKPFPGFRDWYFKVQASHDIICMYARTDSEYMDYRQCTLWPLPHLLQFQSDAFSRLFAFLHFLTGAGAAKTGPWSSAVAGKSYSRAEHFFFWIILCCWYSEELKDSGAQVDYTPYQKEVDIKALKPETHTHTHTYMHPINFLSDVRVQEKGYDLLVHDFRTKEQTHSDNVDR